MRCKHCGRDSSILVDGLTMFYDMSHYNGFNDYETIYLCKNCINELNINIEKHRCHRCSNLFYDINEINSETHNCYYCERKDYINPYNTKPSTVFFKIKDNDLCIGVELETNGAGSYKNLVESCKNTYTNFKTLLDNNQICDFVCLKRDGSIGGLGYELVTHPASLEYHKNNVPWSTFFEKYQISGRNHCGLHFHIDKRYLTPTQQKALDFIINNNVEVISAVSGRKPNHYCYNAIKRYDSLGKSSTRYEIINFQNSKTIEFRCFSSPKKYSNFMYRMEFVDALVKLIAGLNVSFIREYIVGRNEQFYKYDFWNMFIKFVTDRKDIYNNLYKYIKNNKKFNDVIKEYLTGSVKAKVIY